MRKMAFVRILALFLISAILISGVSLLLLNRLASDSAQQHRSRFLLLIADEVETHLATSPVKDIENDTMEFPVQLDRPPFPPPPPEPPPPHEKRRLRFRSPPIGMEFRRGPRPPRDRLQFWIVTAQGHILSNSSHSALPLAWAKIPKPLNAQEVASTQDIFRLSPGLFVLKLRHSPELYLVAYEKEKPFPVHLLTTQAILSFSSLVFAFLLWFVFTFLYLRRKSTEARQVLSRLEQGDLKARFEIKRFDEFGALLIDFNRMADQIEKLVTRVHATESTRKNLLQELGHDLRTPLTSLTTSLDTLKTHFSAMSETDRVELFEMMTAEVKYFTELLESLLVIASIDEPSYRHNSEVIDLSQYLQQEIKSRQGNTSLTWGFSGSRGIKVHGDRQLLQRLFKNAFENAARVAQSRVDVSITAEQGQILVRIEDDGPGLSDEALESFAKRRDQRVRRKTDSMLRFSLGLGSVIMKTIAEAHGGQIQIRNKMEQGTIQGAQLSVILPESR